MKAWIFLAVLALGGCASTHKDFYTSILDDRSARQVAPILGNPEITSMRGDPESTVLEFWEEGYTLVGFSNFVGSDVDRASALQQAGEVGAKYVALSSEYQSTRSGAVPMTTNRTVTTTSTATGSAYGSGGYATGQATGVSTTTVPVTTYIPYSVDRYEVLAMYFAPMKPSCFGIYFADAEDDVKRTLQRNQVVKITSIRRGSPAYVHNLLAGDYIVAADDLPFDVTSGKFVSGQNVIFSVWRDGKLVEVPLITGSCES